MTKKGYNIEGIDFSKGMLDQARRFAKKENVKIKVSQGNAINVKRKNKSYDLILLLGDSIGSVPDSRNRQRVIEECCRILKYNRSLIITFGNRASSSFWWLKHVWVYIKSLFNKKLEFGGMPCELYGKRGIHYNYSKKEAEKSLEELGFKIKELYKIFPKILIVAER